MVAQEVPVFESFCLLDQDSRRSTVEDRCPGSQLAISVHHPNPSGDSRFSMNVFKHSQRKYEKKTSEKGCASRSW